ncbi:MAG: cyclic pyranopterin monophosphate synthase MoaC [Phycisphaerae bacterium]
MSDKKPELSHPELSHIDERGQAHMVDVSMKEPTDRTAVASALVQVSDEIRAKVLNGDTPKGEVLPTARIAGIQAAKRTPDWIPLCHTLPLGSVSIDFKSVEGGLLVVCTARAHALTGVEMEALVGASAAALTVYDMTKAISKATVIGPVRLESKTGGKSGDFSAGDEAGTP